MRNLCWKLGSPPAGKASSTVNSALMCYSFVLSMSSFSKPSGLIEMSPFLGILGTARLCKFASFLFVLSEPAFLAFNITFFIGFFLATHSVSIHTALRLLQKLSFDKLESQLCKFGILNVDELWDIVAILVVCYSVLIRRNLCTSMNQRTL